VTFIPGEARRKRDVEQQIQNWSLSESILVSALMYFHERGP
jgi:hypothetical protein